MGIGSIAEAKSRAVFLDRDGVINQAVVLHGKPFAAASFAELSILPGVREALLELRASGFLLIVVTNQPDVARGTQDRSLVEAMHVWLTSELPLDGFYVCFHDDRHGCNCRKPQPGLLLTAAQERGISLPASYMIGDRWRDVEAGQRAGCRTVWINYGYTEKAPLRPPEATVQSLPQAVAWILHQAEPKSASGLRRQAEGFE